MAKKAAAAETGTEVSTLGAFDPKAVVSEPKTWEMVEQQMKDVLASMPTDVSTAKARDVIRAGAMQFTRAKTAVDEARLALTKHHRDEQKRINEEGGAVIEKIAGYAARARLPLTEWEAAETERQDKISAVRAFLRDAVIFSTPTVPSGYISDRLNEVSQYQMPGQDVLQEEEEILLAKRTNVITDLKVMLDAALVNEENARKVAALEQKQADRDFADKILQAIKDCKAGLIGGKLYPYPIIHRELSEKIATTIEKDVAEAHQDDLELERREALEFIEKVHKAEQIAATEKANELAQQQIRDAAEEAGRQALAKAQKDAEDRLEKQRQDHQAELDRLAKEKADADAEAERVRKEEEQRAADVEHQKAIMRAAAKAIMAVIDACIAEHTDPSSKDMAVDIAVAIANDKIPHLAFKF